MRPLTFITLFSLLAYALTAAGCASDISPVPSSTTETSSPSAPLVAAVTLCSPRVPVCHLFDDTRGPYISASDCFARLEEMESFIRDSAAFLSPPPYLIDLFCGTPIERETYGKMVRSMILDFQRPRPPPRVPKV